MILCLLLRQFGFQREVRSGERLRQASINILGATHVFFLVLVCFAMQTYGEAAGWSTFSTPLNTTVFVPIQKVPENSTWLKDAYPVCSIHFQRFENYFHIAELALMASITYEPREKVSEACAHYFGSQWHVETIDEKFFRQNEVKFLLFTCPAENTGRTLQMFFLFERLFLDISWCFWSSQKFGQY